MSICLSGHVRWLFLVFFGAGVVVSSAVGVMMLVSCSDDDPVKCATGEVLCPDVGGCVNLANSSENCGYCGNECHGSTRCILGECTLQCPSDEFDCNPSTDELFCVNLYADREHCGECDKACGEDEICRGRDCVVCEGDEVRCLNACVDLQSDIQHCGECNRACTGDEMWCECGDCVAEIQGIECPDGDADADADDVIDGDLEEADDIDADTGE